MNTNKLKKFAQETRKKLLKQVETRLEYVLKADSPELREQQKQIEALKKEIKHTGKEQVIDKVAYTWFNRLVALRYMDVNDYQPFHVGVISPLEGYTESQLLSEAKQGMIPDEFKMDRKKINQLLDGTLESQNPQNEVFKLLLVGACNNLHSIFPFLFEPIQDYSELLLPEDLVSEHSVIHDVVEGMSAEDCQQVEILGWLYQFYISEKKDEVFASKGKVKKEEIPAATQLFTPRWIVEYMVQNTVGKLWVLNHPNSRLKEHMPYYIESEVTAEDVLTIDKPEELTLLDQACGSGHILVYGFELLYKIYEEEGYNKADIPELVIKQNLHGFEIDERAAQLAGLAVLLKAREYQRRLFRKSEVPVPNITCFEDLELSDQEIITTLKKAGIEPSDELFHDLQNMQQATNFGSLIVSHALVQEIRKAKEASEQAIDKSDLFEKEQLEKLLKTFKGLEKLATKHCCVVDNPPYMGSSKMNKELKAYTKKHYSDEKADLMTCFMSSGLRSLQKSGFLGMINKQDWMFTGSFQGRSSDFRSTLIGNYLIDSLLHLGPRTFPEIGGEIVQNAAFCILNNRKDKKGKYVRLVDLKNSTLKRDKFVTAVEEDHCEFLYEMNQDNFKYIPGNILAYWLSDRLLSFINKYPTLEEISKPMKGFDTGGDGDRYMFVWWEPSYTKIYTEGKELESIEWVSIDKGGNYRKWFGNDENIVRFGPNGRKLYNKPGANIRNRDKYFKDGVTFSVLASKKTSFRVSNRESIFYQHGANCVVENKDFRHYLVAYLNSNISRKILRAFCPTLTFTVGDVAKLPCGDLLNQDISNKANSCIKTAEIDWNSHEISKNFQQNELIRQKKEGGVETLEEAYDHYKQYWKTKFFKLHENEEELNRQFIEIYGLEDELSPDVPLDEITILQDETKIKDDKLVFKSKEVFAQFVSYAVGCMFGRYSLDKKGLILANQGETLQDYIKKVYGESSPPERGQRGVFLPDEDNIIPVLDDNWFEDDITGLFYQFLRTSFGEQNFEKNLAFLEEQLGYDIRTYFSKYFYKDHYKRYNKRPIYWQFSSENGVFRTLIYMHRYTPDTLNRMLNGYLRDFKSKLNYRKSHLEEVINSSQDATEVNKAEKELRKVESMIDELETYERDILMPLATERIEIDLDDGVLVNYNKFGQALEEVKSLNDPKKKKKVKEFDWIDEVEIR